MANIRPIPDERAKARARESMEFVKPGAIDAGRME